jgi:hypothetical protein
LGKPSRHSRKLQEEEEEEEEEEVVVVGVRRGIYIG